jgi:hypothetical protein
MFRRCLTAVLLLCLTHSLSAADAASNPVQVENALPGATDWQLTRVRLDESGMRSPWIEGYCSRQSVAAGETIDIMVSTDPPRPFRIEIFRMGYYGGRGARLMTTIGPLKGTTQPTPEPAEKDLHECRWTPSHTLTIPEEWVSGVYLGRLTTVPGESPEDGGQRSEARDQNPETSDQHPRSSILDPPSSVPVPSIDHSPSTIDLPYWQSYVIFIVRDERPAEILFQCSDNTWQAYNQWPSHYSIYTHPRGTQGPWADVSFDRPYGREAQYTGVVNDPLTVGSGEFLPLEFPLAYWLEEQGYDVAYCSNSDMLSPERGLQCKVFISVGHDEYWDLRQYESVAAMRDAGVSLMFLAGNAVCWVTPFRESSDGRAHRIIFRGGPYGAENEYAVEREREHGPFPHRGPDEGLLMGARNVEPVNGGGDWIVTRPDHWIFEGTGVQAGDRIPGLIGWEYHGQPANEIPGLQVVASGTAWVGGETPQQWTATVYPGPKENFVFNAATIFWAQGLSSPPGHTLPWSHWSRPHGPDERVQRITSNVLERGIRD